MNLILIKNNFKLMFRSKLIVLLAILGPVLVIAALSSAFHDLLNSGYDISGFKIGYAIESDSQLAMSKDEILKNLEKEDVTCKEYPKSMAQSLVKEGKVDVFLVSDGSKSILYSQKTGAIETRICKYALSQFSNQIQIQTIFLQQDPTQSGQADSNVKIKESTLQTPKTANASDYYGIIEIIYFIAICMIFLAPVTQSERKNHIQSRLIISPTTSWGLYLGKFVPCALMGIVCTAISIVISTFMFDIHWGNYVMSAIILILLAFASVAFGLLCLYIVRNLAASVVILYVIVWFEGFIGGSFETYMFSSNPESVKRMSPLYYANRTLVEYSTQGSSEYTRPCIIFLGAIAIVSAVLCLLLMKRRMEEK